MTKKNTPTETKNRIKKSDKTLKKSNSTTENRQLILTHDHAQKTPKLEKGCNKIGEVLNKSFEITLIKLLNSFEPKQLDNTELRLLILKEILSCQTNLMERSHEKAKNKLDKKMQEIYDEWKIVAKIVDRACFFLYLSGFVATTVLYLLYM